MELFGSLVSIIVLPVPRSWGRAPGAHATGAPHPDRRRGRSRRAPEGRSSTVGGVRLTYRTARVLSAIADYPGASNREVADRAGIVDQGQISKLLGRLEARELIAKTVKAERGERPTRGA